MKNKILFVLAFLWLPLAAAAGDIKPGTVPGSINYQGRLERDNAPVTGIIHLFFRIYNASSGGTLRWQSAEIIVNAAQGIFSANITPPWDVFSRSETLYLEVQVESDVLTPREPLNSVAYALVAKKLEDGSSVSVSSLTAAYQVLLATATGSSVGIGTNSPALSSKLTVSGAVLLQGALCFDGGSCMTDAYVGTSSGGVVSLVDAPIEAGHGGTGNLIFNTGNSIGSANRMVIYDYRNNGTIAIGPAAIQNPKPGVIDIDGTVFVSTWGISERSGGPVPVNGNLLVPGGRFNGGYSDYISIGENNGVIAISPGGSERMRLLSDGRVGIGTAAPAYKLDVAGDMHTNTGLLAGAVSAGGYTGWTSAANEVRAQNGSHLLLQYNNPFNVGIGTDTPREKLHVHGSVLADYGVIASTAGFTGDVGVGGNFTANGLNREVFLTSTTIYGTLKVSGGIGSMAGFPAYIASTQTLTGLNTFSNQVVVSSDILTPSRLGVAMKDFNFGPGRYLQVGDNKSEYSSQDTLAYLVGGDAANARLLFYRGAALAGSLETQGGANLALVVGGQTKTLTDSVYHRIQNSVVWISTGMNTTPAVYVSSKDGNVGIGTTIADPNYKMTLNGVLHIVGTGNGIVFPNGSFISSNTAGSAVSVSNAGDALVIANTGGGGGNVILRNNSLDGLVVDSSGRVGIGTLYPVSKLNVRGGDLVLGNPVNPYSGGPENLIVAGNIVFDGALIQRSLSATQLSGLLVAGDVALSTATGARTGIGTITPGFTLDVNGDINASGAVRTGGTARISATGTVGSGGANAAWDGATIGANRGGTGADLSAVAKGGIPYFSAAGVMSGLGAGNANYLLQANGAGFNPSWVQSIDTNVASTIVRRDGSGNFAGNTITAVGFSGPLSGNVTGNVSGSAATVTAAAQPAITSVGTLTGLTMGGNIVMSANSITGATNVTASTFNGALTGNVTGNVSGTAATVTAAAQPAITSVGTLTGLTVTAAISGSVTGSAATVTAAAQPAITSVGTLTGLTVTAPISGSVTGSAATVTAAAQPAITSVGTLTGLTVTAAISGSVTGSAATVTSAAQPAITSVGTLTGLTVTAPISGSVTGSAATVTSAAQPNITSVGTLSGLTVTGTISGSINGNAATATKPAAAGTSGQVVCWKVDGSLGYCSGAVSGTSSCTCN